MKTYDIVIVGLGIGGLFAANYIVNESGKKCSIACIEAGRVIERRMCPKGPRCECTLCDILCGVGGAGGFSDGKITISPTVGVRKELLNIIGRKKYESSINEVLEKILSIVPSGLFYDGSKMNLGYKGYHIGTDGVRKLVANLYRNIRKHCKIFLRHRLIDVKSSYGGMLKLLIEDMETGIQKTIAGKYVIISVGLAGCLTAERIARYFGVLLDEKFSDIGIRVEMPLPRFAEELLDKVYDIKVKVASSGDMYARTFCVNPRGYVLTEYHYELKIKGVNGHAYRERRKSSYVNFAILCRITKHFSDHPRETVINIAKKINAICGGYPGYTIISSRNALHKGISPTNPKARHNKNIINAFPLSLRETIETCLEKVLEIMIGESSRHLPYIVYAPEIKYFQKPVDIEDTCRAKTNYDIYYVGNASGYTVNLMGAAVMGRISAKSICGEI